MADDPQKPIPTATVPYCPWCKLQYTTGTGTDLAALKRHVKYCRSAPRPRGELASKRAEKGCIEDLFGIATPEQVEEKRKITEAKQGEQMIPTTRVGLKQAGYKECGTSRCKRCGVQIDWYQTPGNKKMPFEENADGEIVPHFASCNGSASSAAPPSNGGSLPHSGQHFDRPRAPEKDVAVLLQEVSELLRMASLKIDALLAKEKF